MESYRAAFPTGRAAAQWSPALAGTDTQELTPQWARDKERSCSNDLFACEQSIGVQSCSECVGMRAEGPGRGRRAAALVPGLNSSNVEVVLTWNSRAPSSCLGRAIIAAPRPHHRQAPCTLGHVGLVSPTAVGRKSYRSVKLNLNEPDGLDALSVIALRNWPDSNQTNGGTLFMRCWTGDRAPAVFADMAIPLTIQREPDQGATVDELMTLTMACVIGIYEQVRQRLRISIRTAV